MAFNAVSCLGTAPDAEATETQLCRKPVRGAAPALAFERVETLLPSGMRLVVEGCCLTGDDPRARVHRLRIVAGNETLYES